MATAGCFQQCINTSYSVLVPFVFSFLKVLPDIFNVRRITNSYTMVKLMIWRVKNLSFHITQMRSTQWWTWKRKFPVTFNRNSFPIYWIYVCHSVSSSLSLTFICTKNIRQGFYINVSTVVYFVSSLYIFFGLGVKLPFDAYSRFPTRDSSSFSHDNIFICSFPKTSSVVFLLTDPEDGARDTPFPHLKFNFFHFHAVFGKNLTK